MPRHNVVSYPAAWVPDLWIEEQLIAVGHWSASYQESVPLTQAEELARDAEELAANAEAIDRGNRDNERIKLERALSQGDISHAQLVKLLQLRS